MKKAIIFLLILSGLVSTSVNAQEKPSKEYMDLYQTVMHRTEWWRDARFGMFIHFGPYAVPVRGKWAKSHEGLTTERYQNYVDAFNQ